MNTIASNLTLDGSARLQPATGVNGRDWLSRAGAAIWRAFEESGHAQARRQLLDFATQCERHQPELAKELRLAASQGESI